MQSSYIGIFRKSFSRRKSLFWALTLRRTLLQDNYYRRTRLVTRSTCKTRLVTHSTRLTTRNNLSTRYLLVVLVVLVCPFACPFVVLVRPLVVLVCPLVVLSVGLFIADHTIIIKSYLSECEENKEIIISLLSISLLFDWSHMPSWIL